MARHTSIVLPLVLIACMSNAQQTASTPPSSEPNTAGPDQKIFIVGPNVSAPELLPAAPFPIEEENCKKKLSGKAVLSFLLDATGSPRNIAFEHGAGSGIDQIAYKLLSTDRFKPAIHENSPVTVPMEDEIELESCQQNAKHPAPDTALSTLSAQPNQKLVAMPLSQAKLEFTPFPNLSRMPQVSAPPVPLNSVEAPFSDEAREKKVSVVCLISLIVDTEGMPRNLRVIRPLGYGLDQNAIDAARKYRFKPAMRKGMPVPMMITIEVNFRQY